MAKTLPAFDYLPPTAGVGLPESMRGNLPPLAPHGGRFLVKHILTLKANHPQLEMNYKLEELVNLDDKTLESLLHQINAQLGIG